MEVGMQIERSETGIRILYTLLFILVIHAVEVVLGVVVLFDLVFALVTRTAPSVRVREFADRVIRYAVEVVSYLTYNREAAPFPFDAFPPGRGGDAPSTPE
jgi:type III secretory pathway component EscT